MGCSETYPLPAAAVVATMWREAPAHWTGLELCRASGVSSGRLYETLHRLERAGVVTSTWTAATGTTPARRTYILAEPHGAATPAAAERRDRRAGGRRRRRRLIAAAGWFAVTVVAIVQATQALSRPTASRLEDLDVYVGAVTYVRHGGRLYDFVTAGGAPFTYPPFAGLLFWPLTYAARWPLQVWWTLATIAATLGIAMVVGRWIRVATPIVATVLLLSAPVSSNLRFGQVSLVLAALVIADVAVLHDRRRFAVLTGIAAGVKLTPLIFIPLLWCAGRRRAAISAVAAFAGCAAIGYAVLPDDSRRFWGYAMWHVERLGHVTVAGNQSLDGAMMRLGIADPSRSAIALIFGATVAMLALRRAGWAARAGDWYAAVVIVGAASIVASPVSWTHHQIWLILAAGVPIAGSTRARYAWALVVLAVMLLPSTTIGSMLGWPPLEEARLLLAVATAGIVPFAAAPVGAGAPSQPAQPDDAVT